MVYGYRYYNPMPFFEKYIPYGSLRTFANSFNINDYADIEFDNIEEQLDSLEEPPYCIRA